MPGAHGTGDRTGWIKWIYTRHDKGSYLNKIWDMFKFVECGYYCFRRVGPGVFVGSVDPKEWEKIQKDWGGCGTFEVLGEEDD